jgi:hypothetical protein
VSEIATVTQPAPPKSPFDLGDTSLHLNLPPKDANGERPRNPDGTFKAETPPPPEPAPAPPPAPPPQRDQLRESMEREAYELGFAEHEIKGMSHAALFGTIRAAARQQIEYQRQQATARTVIDKEVRNPEPPQLDLGVDPETGRPYTEADIHPVVLRALKDNAALKKQLADRDAQHARDKFVDMADAADEMFESWGPEWEHVVGKGTGAELKQRNDPGLRHRIALLNSAGIDLTTATGAQIRRAARRIKEMVETDPAYGGAKKPGVNGKPNPYATAEPGPSAIPPAPAPMDEGEWNASATAIPTSRPPVELPQGAERALRNLEARMADLRDKNRRGGRQSDADIKKGLFPGGSVAG